MPSFKEKIVFIEPNKHFLQERKKYLEDSGYEILVAENLRRAEKVLSERDIDLIVVDIHMKNPNDRKDTSGLELITRHAPSFVPKIILSPFTEKALWPAISFFIKTNKPTIYFLSKRAAPKRILDTVKDALKDRKVFIIYGHEGEALLQVENFVRAIGLKPIVFKQIPDKGKTIIEKIEHYSDIGFAIALVTPDDVGRPRTERKFQARARQNVVFEMGYFMGKLQREKVRALCKDRATLFSDFSDFHGILHIEMDLRGGWQFDLAKELKDANLNANLNGLIERT